MNFELNEDQIALAGSIEKQAASLFAFSAQGRRDAGFQPARWQELADLGWLGLHLPEAVGGLGLGLAAAAPILHAVGEHQALLPYSAIAIQAAALLGAESAERLGELAAGQMRPIAALREAGRSYGSALPCRSLVVKTANGLQLQGQKLGLLWPEAATHLLVSAEYQGEASLWLIAAQDSGIRWRHYRGVDDTPMADVVLDVALELEDCLATGAAAQQRLTQADAQFLAATCQEAVGVMASLQAQTLDYVQTRQQFGRAIGSFQAVQHRLADMQLKLELARSMALLALQVAEEEPNSAATRHSLAAAKVQIGQSGRWMAEQAVQLHGGIGITDECQVSHGYRRLVALDKRCGDARLHLADLGQALAALV